MIATEPNLGVRPANSYTFMLVASPAGAYFKGGINPVSVWLSEDYVRACPVVLVLPNSRATTPPPSSHRHKPPKKAATRWSGSMPSNEPTWKKWAA